MRISLPARDSGPGEPQSRISIGRVEVQVNNQVAAHPANVVSPKAASSPMSFLEARYLTRFGLKP
jgi:hypothetical protein